MLQMNGLMSPIHHCIFSWCLLLVLINPIYIVSPTWFNCGFQYDIIKAFLSLNSNPQYNPSHPWSYAPIPINKTPCNFWGADPCFSDHLYIQTPSICPCKGAQALAN